MSRYTKQMEDGRTVVYGFDHVLGYFLDVLGIPDEQGEREMLIQESSLLSKMSNGKMIELMDMFDLPESQIEYVAMDLPI
jgi:hypothetical protein